MSIIDDIQTRSSAEFDKFRGWKTKDFEKKSFKKNNKKQKQEDSGLLV